VSTFPFRMPEDLKAAVAAQAERAGVSLNQYLLSIVAAHAGSQAEAERYFAARAARSSPARAMEILARAGAGQPPEPGDELPPDLDTRDAPP
jgi:HicB-like protein involved in pilus formation